MGSLFAVTIALADSLSQRSLDRGIDQQLIPCGKRAKSRVVYVTIGEGSFVAYRKSGWIPGSWHVTCVAWDVA